MQKCLLVLVCVLLSGGCTVEVPVGGDEGINLLPPASFVVRGQMDLVSSDGDPVPLFRAETGVNYHLFQHPSLDNELFDSVTTPGTVSRIEVKVRTDLEVEQEIGEIVEVLEVLELIPPAA
jgi:hypothetical protein